MTVTAVGMEWGGNDPAASVSVSISKPPGTRTELTQSQTGTETNTFLLKSDSNDKSSFVIIMTELLKENAGGRFTRFSSRAA